MPGLIKSISTGIISLAVIVLAIFVIVRLLENRITFYPQRILDYSPEDFGLSYEDVFLEPVKSEHIHGWFFAPPGDDKAAPVIVIFHGNGGNISHRLEWIAPFVRRGAGVLLFDYRGYGRSSGSPGEREFEEDALAVWEFLVRLKGIDPERLVSFGRSLGSAPAAWLAAERPVGSLVIEGGFSRGVEMARLIFGFIPVHIAMKNRWEIAESLSRVRVPVMILHGSRDDVVPFSLGEKLARTKLDQGITWWPVQGGSHLDLHHIAGAAYYDRILDFIRNATAKNE